MRYHLFLSYARADNETLVGSGGEGWVGALKRSIETRHRERCGRDLRIFFDTEAIGAGEDWRRRLGEGLRESQLFLAFLSPNYITSPNCIWEWQEYVRREHSAARGDDGITPIFFVKPADLRIEEEVTISDWLERMQARYRWFVPRLQTPSVDGGTQVRSFAEDLWRRNHSSSCELHPWFDGGPDVLQQSDAAERSLDVRSAGRAIGDDDRSLGERLEAIDRQISKRLDRIALADLAPGNIGRGHAHFVGRHRELSRLHTVLTVGGPSRGGRGSGGMGVIATVFSPGGLGKTALARQYAHAYAEFFAAGGTWEVPCEGVRSLGAALLRLADDPRFRRIGEEVGERLELSQEQRSSYVLAASAVMDYLRTATCKRVETIRRAIQAHPDRRSRASDPVVDGQPRALLVLDNVDQPELLGAVQAAQLPAEEWLEVIVTTRLDPDDLRSGMGRAIETIEVGSLPEQDALELLRDFQDGRRFPSKAEDEAAREIVRSLGGWTLAVELVGAYLADRGRQGYLPSDLLAEFRSQGPALVDTFADKPFVDRAIRHGESVRLGHEASKADEVAFRGSRVQANRMETIVAWSLERLSRPARSAMAFASLMMPDEVPLHWLGHMVCLRHPEVDQQPLGSDLSWAAIWRQVHGLRLLQLAEDIDPADATKQERSPTVRIHRLLAEHVSRADRDPVRTRAEVDGFLEYISAQTYSSRDRLPNDEQRAVHPWIMHQLMHRFGPQATGPAGSLDRLVFRAGLHAVLCEEGHRSCRDAMALTERMIGALRRVGVGATVSPDGRNALDMCEAIYPKWLARSGIREDLERVTDIREQLVARSEAYLRANPSCTLAKQRLATDLAALSTSLSPDGTGKHADRAAEILCRAIEILEELIAVTPGDTCVAASYADLVSELVRFEMASNPGSRRAGAVPRITAAIKVMAPMLTPQADLRLWESFAGLRHNFASLCMRAGPAQDLPFALKLLTMNEGIYQKLLAISPGSREHRMSLAATQREIAFILSELPDETSAQLGIESLEKSLAAFEGLLAQDPSDAKLANSVRVVAKNLAMEICRRDRPGDGERSFDLLRRSLGLAEGLRSRDPSRTELVGEIQYASLLAMRIWRKSSRHDHWTETICICRAFLDRLEASIRHASPSDDELKHAMDAMENLVLVGFQHRLERQALEGWPRTCTAAMFECCRGQRGGSELRAKAAKIVGFMGFLAKRTGDDHAASHLFGLSREALDELRLSGHPIDDVETRDLHAKMSRATR